MIDVRNDPRFYLARKRVEQIVCKKKRKPKSELTEEDHKKIDRIVLNDYFRSLKF